MKAFFQKMVAGLVMPLMLLVYPAQVSAVATEDDTPLELVHIPVAKVTANVAIPVRVTVKSKEGIELVRVYFRAKGTDTFFFVPMLAEEKSQYFCMLPAADGSRRTIEYLFLIETFSNRIFTSQTYSASVKPGRGGIAPESPDVLVETSEIPEVVPGFVKNVKIRPVTNYEKHGVVAGLYKAEDVEGSGSNGHYHGTVIATSEGGVNPWLVTGGIVAGVAGIALLAGGGGGSSSSGGGGQGTTKATGAGSWTLNFSYGTCSKTTSQKITCSDEGLVTAVSPTAVGIPLPEDCTNSPFAGLADIFQVGGSCDSVTACEAYSASDLVSKECGDGAMVFNRGDGTRIESWSK